MQRYLVRALVATAGSAVMLTAATAMAQTSTLQTQQTIARALFDKRLDGLSTMRSTLSGDLEKYERACRGKVTTGGGTGVILLPAELAWFVQTLSIDNETTPACRMLVTEIKTRSQHVTRELENIDETARRRGIYPGVMRDLKRGYGFE